MPTPTYTLLDSVTLASSAASVTFSSIDQSYGDLVLVCDPAAGGINADVVIRLNGDTTTGNYFYVYMVGDGSSTYSYSDSTSNIPTRRVSHPAPNLVRFDLMDYSATDKHKTVLARSDSSASETYASVNRWANTSAITSIQIFGANPSFLSGSTFFLYAIAKVL